MLDTIFLRKHSPRWFVLLIDLTIIVFALGLAFLLRYNFHFSNDTIDAFLYALPFVLLVRFMSFVATKTYAGIVRFTSSKDAERIFIVLFAGTAFMSITNLATFYYINDSFLVPYSVLIIEYFVAAITMTASRFIVKSLYTKFSETANNRMNVVIYGADQFGVITKESLERDISVKYKIVAFIDTAVNKAGKKLDGISVYDKSKLTEVLEGNTVSSLIIAKKDITKSEKNEVADICINRYVKVLTIPDFTQWINGELSANQIRNIRIADLLERDPIKLDIDEIKQEIEGNSIMVTGAAGSIGSEIVRQLTSFNPKRIILFDQAESPLYDIELELKEKFTFSNYEIVIGDVTNEVRVRKAFDYYRPHIVYHAAAYKHVPMMENNPVEAVTNNVQGSKMIADMSVTYGVRKFVMVSTDKAVNPTNVMGASKRIAEMYIQSLNAHAATAFVTTRFGNVLGSNGSVIPRFRKQIEEGGPVTVTDARITRYFMTIPEACQLVLEAGSMGKGGEIFVFDMGKSVKIVDLAKKMIRLSGL